MVCNLLRKPRKCGTCLIGRKSKKFLSSNSGDFASLIPRTEPTRENLRSALNLSGFNERQYPSIYAAAARRTAREH
jgi:hypothetical protein